MEKHISYINTLANNYSTNFANASIYNNISEGGYWVGTGKDYFDTIDFDNDHWSLFKKTWDNLPLDIFIGDGGKYRRRRYSKLYYSLIDNDIEFPVHDSFYQSKELNNLNGGVSKAFESLIPYVAKSGILRKMVRTHALEFFKLSGYAKLELVQM